MATDIYKDSKVFSFLKRKVNYESKEEILDLVIEASREIERLDEVANDIVLDDREAADQMINDARLLKELIVNILLHHDDYLVLK